MSKSTTERALATGKSTIRNCLSVIVVAISLMPVGLFVFSKLGRFFFYAELAGNFRLQILLLLLPFPLLLWAVGSWRWALFVTMLTLWSLAGVVLVYLPAIQPPAGPEQLTVMSFNVLTQNRNHVSVLKQINDVDPDVVAIIEYAEDWPRALKKLDAEYPYQVLEPRWHGFGMALFSKHPLTATEVHLLHKNKTDVPVIESHVLCGERKVRLIVIHSLSPTNKYRMGFRNRQFELIGRLFPDSDQPTIMMGDFNCVPWSSYLRKLRVDCGLRDSRQGFGYQCSWHTYYWPLLIPIDHAFVSDEIHVHDRRIGTHSGSDHLPLIFTFSVEQ